MMWAVRDATGDDAAACVSIYEPYVRETAISFETVPPDAAEMARRIADEQQAHAWLVATAESGRVIGYAYAGPFARREAYRWAVETSVYVDRDLQRGGVGRALYAVLLPRLADLGYRRAMAGVALPNEASLGLHRALGFQVSGTFERVGWKNGAWHSVTWLARDLVQDEADPPAEPGPSGARFGGVPR